MTRTNQTGLEEVIHAVARIHAGVLALVGAVLGGSGLFLMTAWLLIKGGPRVGPHLQLLGQLFCGYSVTWPGALVGFFYGAVVGALAGWILETVDNGVVALRP